MLHALMDWTYFVALLALICLPGVLLFARNNIYDSFFETLLKSIFVSFAQFFLIALALFYCRVPVTLAGWLAAYVLHILVTLLIGKTMTKQNTPPKNGGKKSIVFFLYAGVIAVVFVSYLFETIRSTGNTGITGDSAFYWFLKGWTFSNTQDIYSFPYLWPSSYPLLVPVIYSFFIQMNCGLGIAGYAPLLLILAVTLMLSIGWRKGGKLSIIIGLPLSVFLPLFYNDHIYQSYADIPFAVFYFVALLAVIDTLYNDKPPYPAALMLTAVTMTKANGNYLLFPVLLFSLLALIRKDTPLRNKVVRFLQVFGMPLLAVITFHKILTYNHAISIVAKEFMPTLVNEIVKAPNPVFVIAEKAKLIMLHFLDHSTAVPYNYILLAPLVMLGIQHRLKAENRFYFFILFTALFIFLFVVSMLLPNESMKAWFAFGFGRGLFQIAPAITGLVYFTFLELLTSLERR